MDMASWKKLEACSLPINCCTASGQCEMQSRKIVAHDPDLGWRSGHFSIDAKQSFCKEGSGLHWQATFRFHTAGVRVAPLAAVSKS